jgi:GntR family transcriptional repressor for pyruvate dehydrogenase complex
MAVSLLELRRILATEAVALAAVRHTPEQLEAIERFAAEQKARLGDPIAHARGEFALERLIIRATGNIALELVLNMFARFPDDHPEVVAALYDQRDDAAFFYDLILGLIRGGDPVRARDHMRRAFEIIDADWMRRHRPAGSAPLAPRAEPEASTVQPKPARAKTKPRKLRNEPAKRRKNR